jgi:hypothetical protein
LPAVFPLPPGYDPGSRGRVIIRLGLMDGGGPVACEICGGIDPDCANCELLEGEAADDGHLAYHQ